RTCNAKVKGSTPLAGTNDFKGLRPFPICSRKIIRISGTDLGQIFLYLAPVTFGARNMATITKRGDHQYQVKVRRGKFQKTKTFAKLEEARRWARATEADLERGQYVD